ncbi:MAG: M20 family metallopeptidase [Bacteroidota bacterium]
MNSPDLASRIQDKAAQFQADTIALRRHLHAHPELSFEEYETAAYIARQLESLGIPFRTIANTGLLAQIEGTKGPGPVYALRADIDALPILEANEVAYRSTKPGIMHACGHDVHTSSLLGTARILQAIRPHFSGTIKFLFQPGEEKAPGGASYMIRDGALKNPAPAGILGQHVHPPLAAGKVGMRPGIYMASTDELYLSIKGRGGHGAIPQNTVDPIAISAQVITALQQLVSRQADPTLPTVITFGHIASQGGATNIIPNEVRLKGTLRTMNEEWRKELHQRIERVANGIAQALGGSAELTITPGYPFLKNNETLTRRVFTHAQTYLGPENVVELPIRMTGEDFAYYSHEVPACFYRLGTGNVAKGITSPVHTDTFDIDESALEVGSGLMAWLAIRTLDDASTLY